MIFKNEKAIYELWGREEEEWIREECSETGQVKVTMGEDIFIFDKDFIVNQSFKIIKILKERDK